MSPPDMNRAPAATLSGAAVVRGSGPRSRVILERLDLEIHPGRLVGLSGPSGSGKSTLIALLCGELEPTSGSVCVDTAAGARGPRAARRQAPGSVGLVSQDARATLDPLWPVRRVIEQPLRIRGVAASEARRAAREALAHVGLGHLDPRARAGALSIGQCQRVAVARALVTSPRLLLADEPTSALDVTTAAAVAALLLAARDAGAAVVVASHDTRLLDSIADVRLHIEGTRVVPVQPGEGTGGK